MFLHHFILFATIIITKSQGYGIFSNILDSANTPIKIIEADISLIEEKVFGSSSNLAQFSVQASKPTLHLYYETLCSGCIILDSTQFKKVVSLLHQYVDIHTYPYGGARAVPLHTPCGIATHRFIAHWASSNEVSPGVGRPRRGQRLAPRKGILNKEAIHLLLDNRGAPPGQGTPVRSPYRPTSTRKHSDGTVEVTCQHGPKECYGNKLHGCALDIIANATEALLFNACMMPLKSNDESADKCGQEMNIEVDSIKKCANSKKGLDLLVHYGEESKKIVFHYVPYVLLNGKEWRGQDLFSDTCGAFQNPPKPCHS